MIKKCIKCGQEKEHQAKGMCYYCYRKFVWREKKGVCERCHRNIGIHGKGLCGSCYNFVYSLHNTKNWNQRKRNKIDNETYKKITKACVICGFDKVVDLHHIDESRENNSEKNLIGLCPNHHKMLHDFRYKEEMFKILKEKGFNVPEDPKLKFVKRVD